MQDSPLLIYILLHFPTLYRSLVCSLALSRTLINSYSLSCIYSPALSCTLLHSPARSTLSFTFLSFLYSCLLSYSLAHSPTLTSTLPLSRVLLCTLLHCPGLYLPEHIYREEQIFTIGVRPCRSSNKYLRVILL